MTSWTDIQDVVLGYVVVGSVVAAVLPMVAWGLVRLGRMRSAVYRHMVWSWCLVGLIVLPPLWVHAPKLAVPVLPASAARAVARVADGLGHLPVGHTLKTQAAGAPASGMNEVSPEVGVTAGAVPWRAILTVAWATGTALVLVRLVLGMWQLGRIAARAEAVTDWRDTVPLAFSAVRVLLSDAVAGPVCFGLRRATILIPRHMYRDSSPAELRMVLRHEMAHVERRDAWMNLLQRLVEAVLFFHPGAWLASRQLTQQRELICDNWVVADGAEPGEYARILARVAEASLAPRLQAAALFEGRLLQRVRSLLDPRGTRLSRASRRAWLFGMVAGLLILGGFGVVRLKAAVNPEAASVVVKVVNEQGQPVVGAKVAPFGLRALPNSASAYGWDPSFTYGVAPEPVFTDAAGEARLVYPKRIHLPYEGSDTDMETCAIILGVYHADYSPTVEQNYKLDGSQGALVMHPGGTLKLSGYIGSPEKTVTGLYPQISKWNISFKETVREENGVCTVQGVPVGPHYVRLVYWPEKGSPRFSDPVLVKVEAGQTYTQNLELKPAMRLEGKVDASVPRPVRNGYVQVHVSYPTEMQSEEGYDYWDDWAKIAEDGTFHVDALPHGVVQAIGVCDGFTWAAPGVDTQQGYGWSGLSQEFAPQGDVVHVELKMQPAATYEIHTVDADGQPIQGAQVNFVLLARWFSSRGQVVDPLFRSADRVLAATRGVKPEWKWVHYYEATTDSRGIAVVHNLPAFGKPVGPNVEHEAYRRTWQPAITEKDMIPQPGEVKKMTITMVRKGTSVPATQPVPSSQPARSGAVEANMSNARFLIADLKGTFQAGHVEVEASGGANADNRMGMLVMLIRDKIPNMITKRVSDVTVRDAAMARAKQLGEYMDKTVTPAFEKAKQSKAAEDAQTLVAMMDELSERLGSLQKILSAGSAEGESR